MMKRAFVLLLLWGMLLFNGHSTVNSQTLTAVVTPGQPFRVAFDYPSAEIATTNFRLWVDGAIVDNLTTAKLTISPTVNANGTRTVEVTAPGLPAGTHTLQISAWKEGFDDAKSAILPVTSATAPATPINLRIIVTITK